MSINRGKPLSAQIVRVDYIQPKRWWMRPTYRLVLPIYFGNLIVPAGFVTDMGTIPRMLWWLFDPVNQYAHAVIVHDYALGVMSRRAADARFRLALKSVGVSGWRVKAMYNAVRVYGEISALINKRNRP